jgi:hypothetical protein
MLGGMDIAAAEAPVAPWIAVGVLLAVGGFLLAGIVAVLVSRRRSDRPTGQPPPVDDLQTFLESPPGSSATPHASRGDLVTLTAPPPAPSAPRTDTRPLGRAVVTAVAGVAVLLLAAAAVVAATATDSSSGRDDRTGPAEGPEEAEARMRFAGVVLQQHAVGVTVTYPEVELTSDGAAAVARLTLPTWNCLAAEAPNDPEDAGCVTGRTEYAELRSPDLEVTRTDDGMRFGGVFATTTRPTGGAPDETGRSYEIEVSLTVDGDLPPDRWSPADGTLELEDRRALAVEGELRVDA